MLPLSLGTLANGGEKWLLGSLSGVERLSCYLRQMNTRSSYESLMEVLYNVRIVMCTGVALEFVCVAEYMFKLCLLGSGCVNFLKNI